MRFWSLHGTTPYEEARRIQLALVELRAAERIPDTVLFLEHPPIITRGRGLQQPDSSGVNRKSAARHMPVPSVLPAGVAFAETERGGDLTYHGPGQLVVYPIVKLDGNSRWPARDVGSFLRRLERILITELQGFGLAAQSRESATGVWVGDKKVASIGIAVKRWVVYHGIALNVINDLRPFQFISPCGFSPDVMARLADLIPGFVSASPGAWRTEWEERLARAMSDTAPEARPEIRTMTWVEAREEAGAEGTPPLAPRPGKSKSADRIKA